MNSRCLLFCSLLLILPVMFTGQGTRAAEKPEENVSKEEQIRFQQEKARAHMRELEDRMFRLAKLIRETQPDDSARLLLGVRKAREQLILEQMIDASKLLEDLKLSLAAKEQKEIIAKLEELKALLLAADLDLELRLEQLRKIQQMQQRLKRLIKKESQQRDQTETLTKKKKSLEKLKFESLKGSEARNQRSAEDLEQISRQIGPSAAAASGALAGAGSCMGKAGSCLSKQQAKKAAGEQKEAVEKLQRAQQELARLEKKLRKELESLTRQRVMENLSQMITMQRKVRETTEKLAPRIADKQRQAALAARQLAPVEDRIIAVAQQSIELVETTQFSVVLPVALREIEEMMETVSDTLRTGRADADTIGDEKQIEEDLKALLFAMKDSSSGGNRNGSGQCSACKGDRNKLLAEVKMLRWMQASAHRATRRVDKQKRNGKIPKDELRRRINTLKKRQEGIRQITEKLHSMTCRECLGGIH